MAGKDVCKSSGEYVDGDRAQDKMFLIKRCLACVILMVSLAAQSRVAQLSFEVASIKQEFKN